MTIPVGTGETVILITRTVVGQDGDGNDLYGEVQTPLDGCWFDPGGSSELIQGQETVIRRPQVGLPEGSVLPSPVDAVIARGIRYPIDGQPQAFHNPFTGWEPGIVIQLEGVTG